MEHLLFRASARLLLAARRPTPLGRSCFSPAHTHLTSREAGSEIWIYEDLWNVGKEECRFDEDSRGFSRVDRPLPPRPAVLDCGFFHSSLSTNHQGKQHSFRLHFFTCHSSYDHE